MKTSNWSKGAWQLGDLKGPVNLYTRIYCDIIKVVATGKEYQLLKHVVFLNQKAFPPLIEDTVKVTPIYLDKSGSKNIDYLKEIYVAKNLK